MRGRRILSLRDSTLRKVRTPVVAVREITLWQRSDEAYEIAITNFAEGDRAHASADDYPVGPSRTEALAAFDAAVSEARRQGFEGG